MRLNVKTLLYGTDGNWKAIEDPLDRADENLRDALRRLRDAWEKPKEAENIKSQCTAGNRKTEEKTGSMQRG